MYRLLLVCSGTGAVTRSGLLVWYQVSEESSSVSELGNEELWQCGVHITLSWSSLWVSGPVLHALNAAQ